MDHLNIDLSVLLDDYERVVAMESIGYGVNDPTIKAVCKRWSIAREGILDKAVDVGGDLANDLTDKGVRLSAKLIERLFDWFEYKRTEVLKHLASQLSLSKRLQGTIVKLEPKVRLKNDFSVHEIETGKWLHKLSVDGEYDLNSCIEFADMDKVLDQITKSYTVHSASMFRTPRKAVISGNEINLTKISKSTASAIKRAAPILGLGSIKPGRGVEAYPLPGNVILTLDTTMRGVEVVEFAVIRDSELPEKIKTISKHDMERALKAAYSITEQLIERSASRKFFSFGGIYEALEELRKEIKSGNMSDDEIKLAKVRLANAINIEDAITTSMVRVCEGLVEITKRSL